MANILKEKRTVAYMIGLYCKKKHGTTDLCSACKELNEYALSRLDKCPFGEGKPACKDCKVHCYKPEKRESIKQVMRYVGPRMFFYYPIDYIMHKIKNSL